MSIDNDITSIFSDYSAISSCLTTKNIDPTAHINSNKISDKHILTTQSNNLINNSFPNASLNSFPNASLNSSSSNSSSSNSSSGNSSSSNSSSGNSSSSNSSSGNSSSSNCSIINSVIQFDSCNINNIYIDVAVLCEEYANVNLMCNVHLLNLDEISITLDIFQHIFYPFKENFGLNKDFLNNNVKLLPFISFLSEFRTINNKRFNLIEEIIGNIETDLCISRNCFTKESLVQLTNEIIMIKSMLNINSCSVLSSLTWQNILEIIKNYEYTKTKVIPILVVNIVFKTPTPGVKDTIVRFQYKICNIL